MRASWLSRSSPPPILLNCHWAESARLDIYPFLPIRWLCAYVLFASVQRRGGGPPAPPACQIAQTKRAALRERSLTRNGAREKKRPSNQSFVLSRFLLSVLSSLTIE